MPGREQWTLRSARVLDAAVRPGGRAGALRDRALARRARDARVRGEGARGTARRPLPLWLGGGAELARYEASHLPGRYRPTSLDDAWRRLATTRGSDGLYAALFARASEVTSDGRDYPELPSRRWRCSPAPRRRRPLRRGDLAKLDEHRFPVDGLVRGELQVPVQVDSRLRDRPRSGTPTRDESPRRRSRPRARRGRGHALVRVRSGARDPVVGRRRRRRPRALGVARRARAPRGRARARTARAASTPTALDRSGRCAARRTARSRSPAKRGRIDRWTDGRHPPVGRLPVGQVLSLAADGDGVIAGTGPEGLVYRIGASGDTSHPSRAPASATCGRSRRGPAPPGTPPPAPAGGSSARERPQRASCSTPTRATWSRWRRTARRRLRGR